MPEPKWLKESVVAAIHSRQLAEHGGMDGVRDAGLPSSALALPRNVFAYTTPKPDLATLAAAYAYCISKHHPFVDGNKRTGYVLCRTLLKLNGVDIEASEVEKYQMVIAAADGSLNEEQFAAWLREKLV